jgi:hypothetical protein
MFIRVFITSILVITLQTLYAQRSEIGFGIGIFNYTGDLLRNYDLQYSKPAATVLYRSNLGKVVTFRAAITGGKLGASEKPIDAFADRRAASFDIFLLEGSLAMEYHFLNWKDSKRPLRYTPYLFGGLALFGISGHNSKPEEYSNVQFAIPFGGGFKYIVNPKWYVAFEIGIRRTFFDYLDNISGAPDQSRKNYQYANPNDNDNYFFVGLTLTRAFYQIPCPTNPYK